MVVQPVTVSIAKTCQHGIGSLPTQNTIHTSGHYLFYHIGADVSSCDNPIVVDILQAATRDELVSLAHIAAPYATVRSLLLHKCHHQEKSPDIEWQ
jgi:hypothetical protein